MPYCSEAQFTERFGARELAQLLGTGEFAGPKAETGRLYSAAAADADAIVDSYLAQRGGVTLPLDTPHARVLELAADLTRYKLYDDVKDEEKPPAIVARYRAAIAYLKDVAAGKATIPGLFPDPVEAGPNTVQVYAKERVFTDDTLAGY